MARSGKYSFIIEQGSTFRRTIHYKDSSGSPVNLTNYAARLHIRQGYDSNTTIIKLTNSVASDGTGIWISPAVSGTINIKISAYSSSLLTFTGEAIYDLEIYSGSGASTYVKRLLEGKVKLSREVTR